MSIGATAPPRPKAATAAQNAPRYPRVITRLPSTATVNCLGCPISWTSRGQVVCQIGVMRAASHCRTRGMNMTAVIASATRPMASSTVRGGMLSGRSEPLTSTSTRSRTTVVTSWASCTRPTEATPRALDTPRLVIRRRLIAAGPMPAGAPRATYAAAACAWVVRQRGADVVEVQRRDDQRRREDDGDDGQHRAGTEADQPLRFDDRLRQAGEERLAQLAQHVSLAPSLLASGPRERDGLQQGSDRRQVVRRHPHRRSHGADRADLEGQHREEVAAVSYTHLRAHETDSYLV